MVMPLTLEAGCVGLSQVSRGIEMFVVGEKYVWIRGIQNCYNALKAIAHFLK